jgi:hypothetical protein
MDNAAAQHGPCRGSGMDATSRANCKGIVKTGINTLVERHIRTEGNHAIGQHQEAQYEKGYQHGSGIGYILLRGTGQRDYQYVEGIRG